MKNCMRRLISFALAFTLVLGMIPTVFAAETTIAAADFVGKKVSILGDSISTYTGVSNDANANSTISSNSVYYSEGKYGIYLHDTWWQQVIDAMGMELLVNNSWSGSAVFTDRAGTDAAYKDRCVQLHNNAGETPDIIWVYLGTNDYSVSNSSWGTEAAINYETLITESAEGVYSYATPATVCEAYAIMLHKAQQRYPDADIYSLSMIQRSSTTNASLTAANAEFTAIAEHLSIPVVDLENIVGSDAFNSVMGDSLHPTNEGMDRIAGKVISAMLDAETAAYDVTYNLTDVTSSNEALLSFNGGSYETMLSVASGYKAEVTVTMGGTDVTDSCYANGKVAISNVTGDVAITASASAVPVEESLSYRWELNSNRNALVNVTTEGCTENALTVVSGTITDGVQSGGVYTAAQETVLASNEDWVIEWQSSGTGNPMLLTSSTAHAEGTQFLYILPSSKMIALGTIVNGKYENYGVTLGDVDFSQLHTFRLENHVNADGTNMVYLIVDGGEALAMNNYFVGANASTAKPGDGLNGKNITFSAIGNTVFKLNAFTLEYLQIWPEGAPHQHAYALTETKASTCTTKGYKLYTCSCGETKTEELALDENAHAWDEGEVTTAPTCDKVGVKTYTCEYDETHTKTEDVAMVAHTYGEWVEDNGVQTRACSVCGHTQVRGTTTYRWELNEARNGLVNVTTAGYSQNALTMVSGSVSDGVQTNGLYNLAQEIVLEPTQEWAIEWRSSSTGSPMLIASSSAKEEGTQFLYVISSRGLVVLGEVVGGSYENYGVTVSDVDFSQLHTFRLENHVDTDGSNMVYLVVDQGDPIPMNNYFDGAAASTAKSGDGLNGKTLKINALGCANGFQLSKINLEYLQIWPEGTGEHKHTFGPWVEEEDTMRRECTECGETEIKQKLTYRWEYNTSSKQLVSVTTGDNMENPLTKVSGSVTNDTLSSTVYSMETAAVLKPNVEWVIEWQSSGQGTCMPLASTTAAGVGMQFVYFVPRDKIIVIGSQSDTYHNYGLALDSSFDFSQTHTYRLENRVTEDENIVYLVIDDIEIGAMDNYYKGLGFQSSNVNGLNGQTLTFQSLGSGGGFQLNNIKLDYMQIWTKGLAEGEHKHTYSLISTDPGDCGSFVKHVYECECGKQYLEETTEYGEHVYGSWTAAGEYRQRICAICGYTQTVDLGIDYDEGISSDYYNVLSQKEYILCDGAAEYEIILNNDAGDRRQMLHVLEVDVTNPNVEILPAYYGIDKDLTDSANWSAHVMEEQMDYYRDELGYNVVAGMNTALTYTTDAPCSFMVYNGQVLADRGTIYNDNCKTYLAVIKNADGTVYCELRSISEGLCGDEWQAIPANFGFVVQDGQLVDKTVDHTSGADRSMIGVKPDGTLVIVQAEGRNAPYSSGLSSYELGETMLALGCQWAINGDGGGSSQILTKREGESDYVVRNQPSDGTPRATINGIIIASKVTKDGVFDHVSMLTETAYITPGGSAEVEVKGVDGAGAPAEMPEGITYEATGGTFENGVFTSDGTLGLQTVKAFYEGEEIGSVEINVVIPTSIEFDNSAMAVPYGKSVEIAITAYYNAQEVALSGADVAFTLTEEIGTISGLVFTAFSEDAVGDVNTADLTATLVHNENLTVTIPVYVGKGSEVLYDFEDQDLHGWYRSTASEYNAIRVGGDTYLVDSSTGHVHSGDYAMAVELDYSTLWNPVSCWEPWCPVKRSFWKMR